MQVTTENPSYSFAGSLQILDNAQHKRQSLTRIGHVVHILGIFYVVVYKPKELLVIKSPGNAEFAKMGVPPLDGWHPIESVGVKIQAVAKRQKRMDRKPVFIHQGQDISAHITQRNVRKHVALAVSVSGNDGINLVLRSRG